MTFENWWATLTTREKARMVRDDVAEAWAAATAAEREACAKACDDVRQQTVKGASDSYLEGRSVGATVCMSFIRARSNALGNRRAAFGASVLTDGLCSTEGE